YSLDAAQQLTSVGGIGVDFDEDGNETVCGSDRFEYDVVDRLVDAQVGIGKGPSCQKLGHELGVHSPKPVHSIYSYNSFGLRDSRRDISRSGRSVSTSYVW